MFIQVIKNDNFLLWSGLNPSLIQKITPSISTATGHLNKKRTNLQSTENSPDTNNLKSSKSSTNNNHSDFKNLKILKQITYFSL